MDGDRKYRQHGYQDGGSGSGKEPGNEPRFKPTDKPGNEPRREPFAPPRHPLDITAPRLPRMVRNVTASRCFNCANTLSTDHDFAQPCPKCAAELHCCKQCAHFDSAAHFQCAKPIPERIVGKDKRNECPLFSTRVTVARESTPAPVPPKAAATAAPAAPHVSRTVHNARAAFENLFKK